MKTRLLGAFVLIALLVIFVPMFFPGHAPPATGADQSVSLAIPAAQDSNLQTRTMSLTPGAPAAAASVAGVASPTTTAAPASGQLATVDIASRRPADVGTAPVAPTKPVAAGPVLGSGATAAQPVIPLQGKSTAAPVKPATVAKAPPAPAPVAKPVAVTPAPAAAPAPVAASAHAIYVLNLSAYANASSVDHLLRRVRGFGYPVLTRMITQGGKQLTLVTAGPFDSRAAGEAARLKITQAIPGIPAKLVEGLGHDEAAAAAPIKPLAATGAGVLAGLATGLAALGSVGEANALRDKLRASGFDGFVDSVTANGRQLWRVRAGPQTQHADAERVRDAIKAKLGIAGNVVTVP